MSRRDIVRVSPSQIVTYPKMKTALCEKLGAFEVDPVLEPLMIAPTLSRAHESILGIVSFGALLTPSYIPPPFNRMGWKSGALWELASLMLEQGLNIFEKADRIYVTDTSVALGGTRSFPVLIQGDTVCLIRCNRPPHNFPNTKLLISKIAN